MAKGFKSGGRQKGVVNRATAARQKAIAASGKTPLEHLLSVMRNTKLPSNIRLDAAAKAAPYVHPRLTAIEHSGGDEPMRMVVEIRDPTRPASAS